MISQANSFSVTMETQFPEIIIALPMSEIIVSILHSS